VLLNSEFSLLAARHLAGRVLAQSADREKQVELLHRYAWSRQPTPAESKRLRKFLQDVQGQIAAEARPREQLALPPALPESSDPAAAAALVDGALALLNASEFLYID
jgi:hypothetical protein